MEIDEVKGTASRGLPFHLYCSGGRELCSGATSGHHRAPMVHFNRREWCGGCIGQGGESPEPGC